MRLAAQSSAASPPLGGLSCLALLPRAGAVEGRPGVHRDGCHGRGAGRVQRPQDRPEMTRRLGERAAGLAQEPPAASGSVDVRPAIHDHDNGTPCRGDHP